MSFNQVFIYLFYMLCGMTSPGIGIAAIIASVFVPAAIVLYGATMKATRISEKKFDLAVAGVEHGVVDKDKVEELLDASIGGKDEEED